LRDKVLLRQSAVSSR